jgi:HTH-type transcriptional regulator/antitoxin HigA
MIKIIKTDEQYNSALAEVEALLDSDPHPDTEAADKLELLTLLISEYEKKHFPVELPDPIEAVKFRMEQQQLTQKDLIPYIGSRSKVSEVLNRKRPLTLKMIRALHQGFGIPLEVLIREIRPQASSNSVINWRNMSPAPIFSG